MITKGILKTINYNENSCTVRIPLFETTSSTNEVVLPAIFLTQPGSYNGYSEGDVVFVDFENNSLSNPIIIGKLYLGAIKEKATSKKGGLTIADLSVTSSATLPLDTKLTFNAADETVASVEGGYNTYKSLLDIIKALYKTETSVSKTTEEALENITKIKVEYLSQLVTDPEPLKEDPNWSISMPNYKDGYNIWQKTTCYNSKGQILSTEIMCLSAANAIASYWLRCSTKIHSGTQQAETIEITAMTKLGTSPETADEESSLTYRWSKGAGKKPEVADPETPYKLIFRNTAEAPLPNENLIITAYRNGAIYESETIFFSPLNTPTLVLTNENASLEYDSYGFTKMPGAAEFVESTAVIKLNNETITAKSYEWTVKNCSFDSKIGTNTATIRITDIDESSDSATATCEAIYVDNVGNEVPLTKVFSISKIKQGRSLYKLDLSNEFVTIPAVDDGKGSIKIADDYDWDYLTSHTVNAYYGDELLKVTCSTQTPSSSASEKAFHLKYTVNNVSLKSEINQATESEGVTFVLDNLTGKTGTILYELFRGNKKVASSKFEATRLDSGTPATSYWLNISSPIHTGVRQESDIKIQPKLETGNSGQDNDILAYIRCKYVGETSYIEVSKNVDTGEVTLTAPLKDKNILVEASHTEDFSNIYESETITFSPLNTPVIDLTNDSAALTYTAGGLKINKEEGKEDVVESTATLYLNGKPVEGVTYSWTYTDCIIEGTTNSQTIKIKGLLAPKGTATCSVSYWGETFTKVFSITKQIQGEASTSYWLKTSCVVHTGTNQEKAIEATAMKKVGEKTEEPDTTAKLYYRYYNDENWIGGDHILKIENYKDEDLYIVASHKESFSPDKTLDQTDSDIYDWETITFSPLNTPVLDLTNDSDSLTYNAENNKIEVPGQTASVTSTAALYLNGDEVSGATYSWTVEGCSTTDYTVSSNNKTITINAISEDSLNVKATCTATYNGKPYSKVFSVVKQVIATTYWLKVSHPVHVGTNQTEPIRIVAMKKEGTNAETLDNTAYLWYKYKDATTWTKVAEESPAYVLNINGGWEDKDLTIFASHKSYKNKDFTNEEVTETSTEIYDWEVITFSPLNTPTINLTNDTASLVYNYDDTKYSNDVVSTTAELYLNGTHITDGISYEWTADENKCTFKGSTNSATIQVKEIATGSPTAKVTCKITIDANGIGPNRQFAGKTYEKKFVVVKQFKGDPTTTYELNLSHSAINITEFNEDFIVKVGKKVGLQPVQFLKNFNTVDGNPEFIYDDIGGSAEEDTKHGLDIFIMAYTGSAIIASNKVSSTEDNLGYIIPTTEVSKDNPLKIELYITDGTDAGAVLLDSKTVTILEDGAAGESAYKLEIENNFVSIPSDFNGTICLDGSTVNGLTNHIISLYCGSDLQDISECIISTSEPTDSSLNKGIVLVGITSTGIVGANADPVNSSNLSGVYKGAITNLTADTGSIIYKAYIEGNLVATAKFEVVKIKSGEPTTYYKLETDCSTIVRKQDGTTIPETIVAKGYKYTGSTKEEVKLHLEYKLDDSTTWNAGTLPVTVNLKTENVTKSLQLRMRFSDSQTFLDYETIPVIYDGVDGAGGDTFEVQQAFLWTSDYTYIPKLPGTDLNTTLSTEKKWALVTAPTKDNLNNSWKLVFISTRVKTTSAAGEESYSPWDAPAIYLCKNEDSYRRETTAEGLFGQGQGIYYTVINTVKNAAGTADRFTAGKPYDPKELAAYVTEDPDKNKGNVTVYINAEYIKTGALTIGDKNNYIFKADIGTPEVEIGGWNVEEDKLYSGNSTKRVALQSSLINDSFVECIVSDGTQYIDTGLHVNYNTDIVEITYQPTTYDQNGMIFGQWNDATTSQAALYLYKDGKAINFYIPFDGEQKALNTYINYTNLSKQTIRIQKESSGNQLTIYVNDRATSFETYINSLPVATVTSYIASGRRNDGSANWGFKGKIYSCKIWRNGSLIRNYAPYYKANTQTYGLFDLCTNTFTSSGNGYKFDGEYSSIYLGSEESRTAPFSVSNTGHVRASDVSLEGHIISDGGRIGGFTISDSSFTNGVLGQNDFVAIASKDSLSYRVANITDEYKLIVGPSFGVTKTGAVNIANGKFTGEVNAEGGKFSSIESIECLNSLKIGPIELTPFNFNTADIKEKDITFTVTGGRASYIGSSTIYYVIITASQKLAKAIQLPYMLVYATYTGTYGGTSSYNNKVQNIYFNQKITFPANTTTYEISVIADSYDQYGSWRFNDVQVNQIGAVVSAWNSSSNSFVCKASVNTTTESWALKFSQNLVPTSTAAKLSLGVSNQAWDKLYCNSAYAETFYASSDLRLKENIKEFSPQKSILDLPVVEFDFKDSGKHQIGCIAQDLQKLFPELVETKDNGYLTIAENKLVYLLLLEVKKLNAKIESLSTNNKSKGELKQYD